MTMAENSRKMLADIAERAKRRGRLMTYDELIAFNHYSRLHLQIVLTNRLESSQTAQDEQGATKPPKG